MTDPPPIPDGGTSATLNPAAGAAAPATRRRRWFWLAALLLCLALAGTVGGWLWRPERDPPPSPPLLDLEGSDPVVIVAIEKERQRVLQSPRSAAAWGRLGGVLSTFNFRSDALACFAQAEHLDPKEPRWPYHQGVLLLLGNADEAIACLSRAVELCGDKTLAPRLRLSEALLSLARFDEAEENYRLVRQRDPGNPRVTLGLGRIALQRRQWPLARSYLEAAAANRNCAHEATLALAELHRHLGDEEQASQLWRRAERLPSDPRWPDPYIEEILNLHVGKRFRLSQTDRLIEQGRIQEGIARLNELTVDYPDAVEVWFALGQAFYRLGDYPAAERVLAKTLELAPGYAEAHNFLGAARLRQGNLADAETALRKALEIKPDFAYAYVNLGLCLQKRNDTAAALDAFRSAVRCKPEFAAAHNELAELLHQTHHDAEALDEVGWALQLNPNDERAKKLLEKLGGEPRP